MSAISGWLLKGMGPTPVVTPPLASPLTGAALAVADAGDGGGFVATLTGTLPEGHTLADYAVTLYRAELAGAGTLPWAEAAGVRATPDATTATVTGTGDPGLWWWYAVATRTGYVPAVAPPVYAPVRSLTAAVQDRLEAATVARLAVLALLDRGGLPVTITRPRAPIDAEGKVRVPDLPCLIVTSFDQTETVLGGTNGRDDYGKPVAVAFVGIDAFDDDGTPLWHLHRERVTRAFIAQRLDASVPEVYTCDVEPGVISSLVAGVTGGVQGLITLRFRTREIRGLGA